MSATVDNWIVYWSYVVSYAGAEKSDERMALKIRTRAEGMLDGEENRLRLCKFEQEDS